MALSMLILFLLSNVKKIGPWTAEWRVPELALPQYHADDYLKYDQRVFVWSRMETETKYLIRATD